MKIGIITDAIDDSSAGISIFTENLVRTMIKLDKENKYVLVHHTKNDNEIYKLAEELIVPFKKIPFARQYRKIFQLPKILKDFDMIHEMTQIGPFFKKSLFKKIVTIHDITPLIMPENHSRLDYLQHKFGLKIILKNVDKVIVDSKNTKKDILRYFRIKEDKIKVIYGACRRFVEDRKIDLATRYGITKPYILYIGTLEPRKNIPNIIKAFAQAKTDARLVVAGKKGWQYEEIFKLVQDLNIQNRVLFPGFIDDEDLINLYSNAEMFLFPSLYEGFGLPILEAFANGCPVITSDVSSLPEVAGDACILVNPTKVPEIKIAIESISCVRETMIKKGLEQVKKFSWEKAAKETIEVYYEISD